MGGWTQLATRMGQNMGQNREIKQAQQSKFEADAERQKVLAGREDMLFAEQFETANIKRQQEQQKAQLLDQWNQLSEVESVYESMATGQSKEPVGGEVGEAAQSMARDPNVSLQFYKKKKQLAQTLKIAGVDVKMPEKVWAVDPNGRLGYVDKDGPMNFRQPSASENYVTENFPDMAWGSQDFASAVDIHRQGGFEDVTVMTPTGPQEVPRYRAESLGLITEDQHKFNQEKKAEETATKAAQKERRIELRSLGDKAASVKRESSVAQEAVNKAIIMLQSGINEQNMGAHPDDVSSDIMGELISPFQPNLTGRQGALAQTLMMNAPRDKLEGLLTTIKSNVSLNKMSELKSQSATGSTGFGALSAPELKLLTGVMGSLDLIENDNAQLIQALEQIAPILRKITEGFIPGDVSNAGEGNVWGAKAGTQMMFLGGEVTNLDNWEAF